MKYLIFVILLFGTACSVLLSGLAFPTVIALLILVLAVAADFYTTLRCLKRSGKEGNPIVAFLFRKIGLFKSFGLLVVIWTCFIVLRWLPQSESIQTAVALSYWLVPVNNLLVLVRLKRKNCVS